MVDSRNDTVLSYCPQEGNHQSVEVESHYVSLKNHHVKSNGQWSDHLALYYRCNRNTCLRV